VPLSSCQFILPDYQQYYEHIRLLAYLYKLSNFALYIFGLPHLPICKFSPVPSKSFCKNVILYNSDSFKRCYSSISSRLISGFTVADQLTNCYSPNEAYRFTLSYYNFLTDFMGINANFTACIAISSSCVNG